MANTTIPIRPRPRHPRWKPNTVSRAKSALRSGRYRTRDVYIAAATNSGRDWFYDDERPAGTPLVDAYVPWLVDVPEAEGTFRWAQ